MRFAHSRRITRLHSKLNLFCKINLSVLYKQKNIFPITFAPTGIESPAHRRHWGSGPPGKWCERYLRTMLANSRRWRGKAAPSGAARKPFSALSCPDWIHIAVHISPPYLQKFMCTRAHIEPECFRLVCIGIHSQPKAIFRYSAWSFWMKSRTAEFSFNGAGFAGI